MIRSHPHLIPSPFLPPPPSRRTNAPPARHPSQSLFYPPNTNAHKKKKKNATKGCSSPHSALLTFLAPRSHLSVRGRGAGNRPHGHAHHAGVRLDAHVGLVQARQEGPVPRGRPGGRPDAGAGAGATRPVPRPRGRRLAAVAASLRRGWSRQDQGDGVSFGR